MSSNDMASRRALLAGAAAGVAALTVDAVGRAPIARAATGDSLVLGEINDAANGTSLVVSGNQGMYVDAAASPGGFGVAGRGHYGVSGSGTAAGVNGMGLSNGIGVSGFSSAGDGSGAPDANGLGIGVMGESGGWGMLARGGDTGIIAESRGERGQFPRAIVGHAFNGADGVHGMSLEAEAFGEFGPGFGVAGESSRSAVLGRTYGSLEPGVDPAHGEVIGVHGVSQTTLNLNGPGVGVKGSTGSGIGVVGVAHTDGTGVEAVAGGGGLALRVVGPVEFVGSLNFPSSSGTAGRGTIPLGASRVTVTTEARKDWAAPAILVTLQGDPRGKRPCAFSHVEIGPWDPEDFGPWTFDVVLSGPAGRDTTFAFFIFNPR